MLLTHWRTISVGSNRPPIGTVDRERFKFIPWSAVEELAGKHRVSGHAKVVGERDEAVIAPEDAELSSAHLVGHLEHNESLTVDRRASKFDAAERPDFNMVQCDTPPDGSILAAATIKPCEGERP